MDIEIEIVIKIDSWQRSDFDIDFDFDGCRPSMGSPCKHPANYHYEIIEYLWRTKMPCQERSHEMIQTISARELQATMGKIVNSVNRGEQFVVMYKSRPAFRIVPLEQVHSINAPLADDPIYRSQAVGRSKDGLCAAEHDKVLYGVEK